MVNCINPKIHMNHYDLFSLFLPIGVCLISHSNCLTINPFKNRLQDFSTEKIYRISILFKIKTQLIFFFSIRSHFTQLIKLCETTTSK